MVAPDTFARVLDPSPGSYLGALMNVNPGPFSDANDLPVKPRAVHVSVAGNIKYIIGGVTNTEAFEVGWHPIRPDRIFVAGTTATLTAWW